MRNKVAIAIILAAALAIVIAIIWDMVSDKRYKKMQALKKLTKKKKDCLTSILFSLFALTFIGAFVSLRYGDEIFFTMLSVSVLFMSLHSLIVVVGSKKWSVIPAQAGVIPIFSKVCVWVDYNSCTSRGIYW